MRSIAFAFAVLSGVFLTGPLSAANAANENAGGLATWIKDWKGRAHSVGTYAVPDQIRKNYRHAFPAGLFDSVTYRVAGDPRIWKEASHFGYGNGNFVVLDTVVLFRSEHDVKSIGTWHQALSKAKEFQQKGIYKVAATHHYNAVKPAQTYRGGVQHKPTRREFNDFALRRHSLGHGHNAHGKKVYKPHHGGVVFIPKKKVVHKKHHQHSAYKHGHSGHKKVFVKKGHRFHKKAAYGKYSFFGKKIIIR